MTCASPLPLLCRAIAAAPLTVCVSGALGCVVLALVADLLLAGAQRLLTPWTRETAA